LLTADAHTEARMEVLNLMSAITSMAFLRARSATVSAFCLRAGWTIFMLFRLILTKAAANLLHRRLNSIHASQ